MLKLLPNKITSKYALHRDNLVTEGIEESKKHILGISADSYLWSKP